MLEWCQRMQFLFDVYQLHDPSLVYTEAILRNVPETPEFVQWAAEQTKPAVLRRIEQLRAIRPDVPVPL